MLRWIALILLAPTLLRGGGCLATTLYNIFIGIPIVFVICGVLVYILLHVAK